jgi:hypothetical protein
MKLNFLLRSLETIRGVSFRAFMSVEARNFSMPALHTTEYGLELRSVSKLQFQSHPNT